MAQNVLGPIYFIRTEELNTRDLTISCYFIKIHRNTEAIYLLDLAQNWYKIANQA